MFVMPSCVPAVPGFEDTGSFVKGDFEVENYAGKAYGEISLENAFRVSSNQVFCSIGYDLGDEKTLEIAERFGINSAINFDVATEKSRIEYKKMTNEDCALVGIGQGQLLVTPLQMAMICSSVANGGKMLKPYVVGSVTKNNIIVSEAKTKVHGQTISAETAAYLNELMIDAVENGTGRRAKINGITVAGKTGTAENETDKDHAWFVGYAPADSPKIAVAVILENDGRSGGDAAAPIAGNVMRKYLNK
jgi:peptidoglycan glycosyltransferase